jgi:hypothetical protein
VGPRAGLDAGARRKILCPCRGSNPDRPARSQTLYCLSYRGSLIKIIEKQFVCCYHTLYHRAFILKTNSTYFDSETLIVTD